VWQQQQQQQELRSDLAAAAAAMCPYTAISMQGEGNRRVEKGEGSVCSEVVDGRRSYRSRKSQILAQARRRVGIASPPTNLTKFKLPLTNLTLAAGHGSPTPPPAGGQLLESSGGHAELISGRRPKCVEAEVEEAAGAGRDKGPVAGAGTGTGTALQDKLPLERQKNLCHGCSAHTHADDHLVLPVFLY
jgi:hypothetical protein